jgi:ClpP class serine protease
MAASAAYWLASQTDHIEANATAQVGSIGVYSVMVDSSQAYEDAGIRVHVVRSGSHKGSGVEGSPITPEDISEEQRMIDQLSHMFAATVARGRGLTPAQVAELATGQVWLAADALKLGLIDSIYGLAMAETETKVKAMEEEEKAPEEQPAEEEQSEVEELSARVDSLEARIEELEGEVEEETAKAAAALAALGEVKATRKGELMAKAISDGKVTPAMMPAVEAFAEACGDNVESLAGFIENLPVQTREQAQTQHPAGDARGQVSASDAQICKALGLSQESFVNNSKWDSIGFDGKPSTKGGLH